MSNIKFSTMADAIEELEKWEAKSEQRNMVYKTFCDKHNYRLTDGCENLFELCESPAEKKLLHILFKGYSDGQIFPQVNTCGFRVDFVTSDDVAWEVDGIEFHNTNRDEQRDRRIMSSGLFRSIIRVPAGAVHYNYEACKSVFNVFCSHEGGFDAPSSSLSVCDVQECFKSIANTAYSSPDRHDFVRMNESDAFQIITPNIARVGGALAFCSGWENHVHHREIKLMQHSFLVTKRD